MLHPNIRKYLGVSPTLGNNIFVDPSSIIIGNVHLGADVSVWPLVAIRGDVNSIRIGDRTNIQDGSILHVTGKSSYNPNGNPLLIGNDVTVGHKCVLHGCKLGDRILVGMGAIVMDNAIVENDVLIAAGSVVPPNKTLVSGYLYKGNPVKQARELNENEIKFLKQSALNYVELKSNYLE